MRVRSDLAGVVYAHHDGFGVVCLTAGDPVPAGAHIGGHLTDPADGHTPPAPAGAAVFDDESGRQAGSNLMRQEDGDGGTGVRRRRVRTPRPRTDG